VEADAMLIDRHSSTKDAVGAMRLMLPVELSVFTTSFPAIAILSSLLSTAEAKTANTRVTFGGASHVCCQSSLHERVNE
jgi:hypothetical protein